MGASTLACVIFLAMGATGYPVTTQPIYQPIYQQQIVPQGQYRQQPVYYQNTPTAHPVIEQVEQQQLPQQYVQPAQPIAQPLLGNVDRQIQKAATHIAGPNYAQQIAQLQLQGQAQQAQAQVVRNALRVSTAPRAQPQLQYQRALQGQPQPQEEELQEDYNSNPSYQFGFDVKDDLYTNYQNRKEQREGDKITGSYSVVDSDGFIRTVTYTADPKQGFKAEVTRQPTDIVVKIPQPQSPYPHQNSEPQYQQVRQQPQYEVAGASQALSDQGKQQQQQQQQQQLQQQQQQQQQRFIYQYQ